MKGLWLILSLPEAGTRARTTGYGSMPCEDSPRWDPFATRAAGGEQPDGKIITIAAPEPAMPGKPALHPDVVAPCSAPRGLIPASERRSCRRSLRIRAQQEDRAMIDFVVHDEQDSVGVIVVEGATAGQTLTGWVMEQDSELEIRARQDIPIGHKVAITALKKGDTVIKYGVDIGTGGSRHRSRRACPRAQHQDETLVGGRDSWHWHSRMRSSAATAARTGGSACATT